MNRLKQLIQSHTFGTIKTYETDELIQLLIKERNILIADIVELNLNKKVN